MREHLAREHLREKSTGTHDGGLGIPNTLRRLELLYGDAGKCRISIGGGRYLVSLSIPEVVSSTR